MTNREKLLNTNIYDLLLLINSQIPYKSLNCVIDYIEGKNRDCIESGKCSECIQQYLNEESKNTTII